MFYLNYIIDFEVGGRSWYLNWWGKWKCINIDNYEFIRSLNMRDCKVVD